MRRYKNPVLLTLLYTGFSFAFLYPFFLKINLLLGPPEDNQMFVWNICWFKYALMHLKISPFFTNYLFYPQGESLVFHTLSPLNCVIGLALQTVFNTTITYNLLILSTFIIGALGMFYLGKQLGLGDIAAFFAGLIFSFSPFHLAHAAHHLNISSIHLLPWLLLMLLKYTEKRQIKHIIIASLILAANFYYSYYIFLFSIILISPLAFFKADRQSGQPGYIYFKPVLMTMLFGAILALPLLIPMAIQTVSGPFVKMTGHNTCVVDAVGILFPHRYHWTKPSVLNYLINTAYKGNYWESAAFAGYFVLPVAIWAICKIRFHLKNYLLLIGIIGLILSFGTNLTIFGRQVPFLKMPFYLFENIPGLSAARSPSRFIVLFYFSLALFAAFGIDKYLNYIKLNKNKIYFYAAVSIVALFI